MIEEFRDLENEIVFSKKETVFTSSRKIAKAFNRRHDHILKLIKDAISDLQSIDYECKPTFYNRKVKIEQPNGGLRIEENYEMDRGAFMFLMMKMKGRKADLYKLRFIQAFDLMEQWIKDRAVGRGIRLSMTDSIKNYLPDSPNKKFKYKHFTDLVYKKVLGKTKKQIETELNTTIENLRDICTNEQLKQFEDYENEISVLLKYGKEYNEIKEMLK